MRATKLCLAVAIVFATALFPPGRARAADPPSQQLITPALLQSIREWSSTPVVRLTLAELNRRQVGLDQAAIDALDKQWRDERAAEDQPLITAVLSSPLSGYLLRIQAASAGLFTELFVITAKGLNAGQSSVTSDYWQADEAKFQKTYDVAADAVFVDKPEFDKATATWRCQINLTLTDAAGAKIGALTAEVNLTELERRVAAAKGS